MVNSNAKWNVMVYQAGDNNLSEEMIWSLKDMMVAKVGNKLRLFAQFDPMGATPRRLDGRKPTIGAMKELNDDDIKAAVKKTLWYKSLCAGLERVSQSIPNIIPAGSPHSGSAAAALNRIEEVLEVPDDFAPTIRALNTLEEGIRHELTTDGGNHSDAHKRELLNFLSYVKQASHNLREVESLDKFREFMKENSAAPEMIEAFFDSSLDEVPEFTANYLFVFSGHGSGAVGDFLTDDGTLSSLSIPKLAEIIQNVTNKLKYDTEGTKRKIDIVGMESCLMSMAEVCYGLRKNVSYLVGSEGLMLNSGWPYEQILGFLREKPSTNPKALATQIVKEYIWYYTDYEIGGLSTDLSACNLNGMDRLADAFRDLVGLLSDELIKKNVELDLDLQKHPLTCKILLAHWEAQSYQDEQYVDLWDFCERVKAHCSHANDKTIINACTDVQKALAGVVMISGHTGAEFQHSTGLSIYLPWAGDDFSPEYKELEFAKYTGWGKFLEELFLKSTRRARYGGKSYDKEEFLHYDVVDNPVLLQLGATHRNPKLGTKMNPKLGTKMNPKLGTKMGTKKYLWPNERGTMKNTPYGFYPSRFKKLKKDGKCVPMRVIQR